jgi:hypothetical protein
MIRRFFIILLALGLFFLPDSLFAEPYISVYAGGTIVEPVKTSSAGPQVPTTKNLDADNSVIFGGKIGYNMETAPFAFEVDVFYLAPDIPRQRLDASGPATFIDQDIDFIDIGLHGLFRWPLYYRRPKLAVEPYLGIGLGFFHLRAKDSVSGVKDEDSGAAFHALAGSKIRLTDNIYLFGEYKYVLANTSMKKQAVDMNFKFHNIYGGIEYRFNPMPAFLR